MKALTDTERKMLAIVGAEPRRCNDLGTQLWGRKNKFYGGSAPYARPAGRILHSLQRQGLVVHVAPSKFVWGYVLTAAGRKARSEAK